MNKKQKKIIQEYVNSLTEGNTHFLSTVLESVLKTSTIHLEETLEFTREQWDFLKKRSGKGK